MLKAVVFDFDGTIADTFPLVLKTANTLLAEMGKPPIANAQSYRDRSAIEIIRESGISVWKLPSLKKKAVAVMANEMQEVQVFSGLPEAIAGLREHFTVCVITSNEPEPVEAVLRKRGVLVDHVHAGSSIFGKDRAIRSFLRAEGVEPGEAVYVGDEVRDVEAAHKAGVRVISVTWGFNSKKRLKQAQPDYLVDTPAQLMRAIRSAARQNSHI